MTGMAGSLMPNMPVAENWYITQLNLVKFSYLWTIKNFSLCREETGISLKSSTFPVGKSEELKLCLSLYPNGYNQANKIYLSLFLNLASFNNISKMNIKYKFSILNANREETMAKEAEYKFVSTFSLNFGFNQFLSRDFLLNKANGVLPDDNLTIFCEGSVVEDYLNISGKNNMIQIKVPDCHLADDLGALFDNEKFTDVNLVVGDRQLKAHKATLAARSPVFAAMFEHEMEERQRNRVDITDVDHEVMREMLYFIYTGKAPNLDAMSGNLLAAADKYALERLKVMCEESLYINLSIETAADTLMVAGMHSADQLKAQTIDFICRSHITEVMKTAGWKNMISLHPNVIEDVLRAYATQQEKISPIEPPRKRAKQA